MYVDSDKLVFFYFFLDSGKHVRLQNHIDCKLYCLIPTISATISTVGPPHYHWYHHEYVKY